jgi:hypothetical protein
MKPGRVLVGFVVVCSALLGLQNPASANQVFVVYAPGGVNQTIGAVNGGQGAAAKNDGWYLFYSEKVTHNGIFAETQIAYSGSDGWEVWGADGSAGNGGETSLGFVGVNALFVRTCLLFSTDGSHACGPAVAAYDDGT